jgi:plastocyanin
MGASGRGEAASRPARRAALLAAAFGGAGALIFATASPAEGPVIEAAGPGSNGYYWRPASASVTPGGTVSFKSTSGVVPHGVTWTSGPESPSCAGVPIDEGQTSWSGSCTFAQAGTYAFKCPVHPTEMTGTITVGTSSAPPPPPGGSQPESPLDGPVSQALRLARSQRGAAVRGSIALSQAAAGGRLEVDLLARRAALFGSGGAGKLRVGRLVRSSLRAGRVSFAVSLKRVARRALRRHRRLALTVRVTVVPPHGETLKLTRGVVVHA